MKTNKVGMMTLVVILLFAVFGQFTAFGQGYTFSWTQCETPTSGTVLKTPGQTLNQSVTTALDTVTTYGVKITMDAGSLNISRTNWIPLGPGAGTFYSVGPIPISQDGCIVKFATWLTSTANNGSAQTTYDITVDGLSVPWTVHADWEHRYAEKEYRNPNGIPFTEILFNYRIDAINATAESGMSITVMPIPEPCTSGLLFMGIMGILYFRRK